MTKPSDAALRGRIGAFVTHSRHDPHETTAKARETFLGRFVDEVDPNRTLPEPERLRRADAARHAYFAALAYKSARARSKRKAAAATVPPVSGSDE